METADATGPLSGEYDRTVSTVAVRPIPASWLDGLRSGGRLVTTIAGTALILTADKTSDGGAVGRIEWDRAGFMTTRSGPEYPPRLRGRFDRIKDAEGQQVRVARSTMAGEPRGCWTVTVHGQGPAARMVTRQPFTRAARAACGTSWTTSAIHGLGSLPVYGARATINSDGAIYLERGRWQATIS